MLKWFKAAEWLYVAFKIAAALVAAVGFFRFFVRTRYWFPKYVHWMAAGALLLGLTMLALMPWAPPEGGGDLAGVYKAVLVLLFPAIVYLTFVFFGGQHATYIRQKGTLTCPHCRGSEGIRGTTCELCGQTIA